MATTNIFRNSYEQPENKLTYNFLCLIEHMENQKAFCEFLIDNKFKLSESADVEIELQPYKAGSIPDGKISFDNGKYLLFFENKTHRMKLDIEQLERHLEKHCQNENAFLLVITSRGSDKGSIDSLNKQYDNKVVFKTWAQVADKLEHLPSFMAKQFVEYGKLSGEFEYMNEISSTDIDCYCNLPGRMQSILKEVKSNIDFTQYELIPSKSSWDDKDGRMGHKFFLNKRNDYGQWFFYGIYYNTKVHQIIFKEGVPELAFFFGINPDYRKQLSQNGDFKSALGNLEKLDEEIGEKNRFEENLTKLRTHSKWLLLFKRVPLTELGNFSYQDVKKRFEEILSQLKNEEAFYQEMMAPPE